MIDWHRHFRHDPVTGTLFWKPAPDGYCKNDRYRRMWNTRFAGKVAGWRQIGGNGVQIGVCVRVIGIKGILLAHRIIWEMHNGPIPDGLLIDHKNGNPFDNTTENLRLATHSQNMMNSKMHCDNRYGLKGIRLIPCGRYEARIQANGKKLSLGTYPTKEQAHEAYCNASKHHHGAFARTA